MEAYDWNAIVDGLNRYSATALDSDRHEALRDGRGDGGHPEDPPAPLPAHDRPDRGQARQLGWTVGITMDGPRRRAVRRRDRPLAQDDEWLSGKRMAGVWFKTLEDASRHQHAMDCVPYGRYEAMAVSPLTSGRLDPPDICLVYGTPAR